MNATRVSVCIPTYNGETYLAEAIRSVLSQSYDNFELLIVDDQSTDETLQIARSFADPRITIHQNDTQLGIPGNWNRCLALAQGEYICVFHQDDVMLPFNLERKVALLEQDPAITLVHSAIELLLEESAPGSITSWVEDAVDDCIVDGMSYFRKLFLKGNLLCAPSVIVRRQQILDLGGFTTELKYTPDYEMWLRLCVEGKVAFIAQPLLLYRWHEHNASHPFRFEKGVEETLTARRRALQYYKERTGRQEDVEILQTAMEMLAEARRYAMQLERLRESQGSYVKDLEQTRDRLWTELQHMGECWEEQKAYIEHQQTYIRDLEQTRDRLWNEVQTNEKLRNQQSTQVHELEKKVQSEQHEHHQLQAECERLQAEVASRFSKRVAQFAQRVWRREKHTPL